MVKIYDSEYLYERAITEPLFRKISEVMIVIKMISIGELEKLYLADEHNFYYLFLRKIDKLVSKEDNTKEEKEAIRVVIDTTRVFEKGVFYYSEKKGVKPVGLNGVYTVKFVCSEILNKESEKCNQTYKKFFEGAPKIDNTTNNFRSNSNIYSEIRRAKAAKFIAGTLNVIGKVLEGTFEFATEISKEIAKANREERLKKLNEEKERIKNNNVTNNFNEDIEKKEIKHEVKNEQPKTHSKSVGENTTDERSVYTKVVGVTFNNRQSLVRECYIAQILTLMREKNNPYDVNAIAVWSDRGQLGYISKELARDLAPKIDKGIKVRCVVEKVTGGQGYNYGINISLRYIEDISTENGSYNVGNNRIITRDLSGFCKVDNEIIYKEIDFELQFNERFYEFSDSLMEYINTDIKYFIRTVYLCPHCKCNVLYYTSFRKDGEQEAISEDGIIKMKRVYTCYICREIFTPLPGLKLDCGKAYRIKFYNKDDYCTYIQKIDKYGTCQNNGLEKESIILQDLLAKKEKAKEMDYEIIPLDWILDKDLEEEYDYYNYEDY